jgi:S-adenosylmethionine synthetase
LLILSKMAISFRPLSIGPEAWEVEVVEHKGIGHPDGMCDALAEAFGVALARYYVQRFGEVLHFNVDKALLVGGRAAPELGGGRVLEPIRVILAGRATRDVRGARIPVEEIARESSRSWVRSNMHALDPDRHVTWECAVGSGSTDLVDIFRSHREAWRANDTSFGVGYAPQSTLERAVLAAARELRSLSRVRQEVGEDVKVMGVRRGVRVHLTVACAFLGGPLASLDAYAERKASLAREVARAAGEAIGREVAVGVNVGDDLAAGRAYFTVTGTSAEGGDDGQVGRGNRVNGLITPCRPMSLEAAAGKNPVSHIGKLYNVAAHRIAASLVRDVPEIAEAHCLLLGCIGQSVDTPSVVDVAVRTREGQPVDTLRPKLEVVVREGLQAVGTLADQLLRGEVQLF